MLSSLFKSFGLVGALLAIGSHAKPIVIPAHSSPVVARSQGITEALALRERTLPAIVLGEYDLTTSYVDDVLFDLGVATSSGSVGGVARLELICVDCRTWGSVEVSTSGVAKDEDILQDIISFFTNPIDSVMGAFGLDVTISFDNVGGHFEFDLLASDTVSYSYPLFMSETLAGNAISEDVSMGMVLFIDLVFSLTAEIDMEAGFEFAFPDGASITLNPLSGDIISQNFLGGGFNNLPVIVTSGSATFEAALRVRVQAGTTVMAFGTGFDFEVGVWADLIEYEATLGTSDDCSLYLTESLDVNIGAFAHAVAEINYKSWGVMPVAVTTILDVPLPGFCLGYASATALPTLPSGSAVPVVSMTSAGPGTYTQSAGASATASASATGSVPFFSLQPSATSISGEPYITTAPSSGPGSIIVLPSSGSGSSVVVPSYGSGSIIAAPSGSGNGYANTTATITSPASLITSTVYATSLVTVTSCASTVLHCPASASSEVVITQTVPLYTTVCPAGAVLPATLPASVSSSASSAAAITSLVSPIPLTPGATPAVSTIYTPTIVNPTYTMPTATSFAVPYPNWNATATIISSATIIAPEVVSTGAAQGVVTTPAVVTTFSTKLAAPSASGYVSGMPKPSNNATGVVTSQPTSVPFTGAAAGVAGSSSLALMMALGMMMVVLL